MPSISKKIQRFTEGEKVEQRIINEMPVKTWNWLKMNGAAVDVPDRVDESAPIVVHVDGKGESVTELPFVFDDGTDTRGTVQISVDNNIKHTTVMDFSNKNGGYADVNVDVKLAKGAVLILVQVFRLGDDFTITDRVDADVDEKADFRLLQVFIRGGKTYADVRTNLRRCKSALHIDTGYLTTQDHLLDINYVVTHTGELSTSDISVLGSLCDEATKRFRGTIDFRNGCIGAKGNELESVLLLDDEVVNQTIPVILCEEEDVEGNHGATIGRLDEETLMYMKSRGLDEEAIRAMMKTAYVDAALNRVPEEASEILDRIRTEEGLGV